MVMTEWYIPITILPAIGLLLMSTTALSNALSTELSTMIKEESMDFQDIIRLKISQLGLLNRALVGFYISSGIFALSGFVAGVFNSFAESVEWLISTLMLAGIVVVLISLIVLIVYSIRAVQIKKTHFQRRLEEEN